MGPDSSPTSAGIGVVAPIQESGPASSTTPPAEGEDNRFAPGGPIADAELGKYFVEMTASIDGQEVGTMTFDLWTEGAPITTRNYLRLVDEGFYDGLTFHRISRDFMIQGGDPLGNGLGSSPHGNIQAEFSTEPERAHRYGVLSMARGGSDVNSASSQFFLCCDESPSTWGLDGKYTSFGKLTSGVATLEALANVKTVNNGRGEISKPTQDARIKKAVVKEGKAPTGEVIERTIAPLDLGGEAESVTVQRLVVSFKGIQAGVERTKEEAEALAKELFAKIEGGADMNALILESSDEDIVEGDETPGQVTILNEGVRDRAQEREMFLLQNSFQERAAKIRADLRQALIKKDEADALMKALGNDAQEAQTVFMEKMRFPRNAFPAPLTAAAFALEKGDTVLVPFDPTARQRGFSILRRVQ